MGRGGFGGNAPVDAKGGEVMSRIRGSLLLYRLLTAAAYMGYVICSALSYSGKSGQNFRWLLAYGAGLLGVLFSIMVFSSPALYDGSHKRKSLFLSWIPRWLLVSCLLTMVTWFQWELTYLNHLRQVAGFDYWVNFLQVFVTPLAWAGTGAVIGSVCRFRWYMWPALLMVRPIVIPVLYGVLEIVRKDHYGVYVLAVFSLLMLWLAWWISGLRWQSSSIPVLAHGSTKALIAKEIQLQRNNILLTVAALVLFYVLVGVQIMSGQEFGSFQASDIRAALLSCFLIPTLTLILPAMMGSTAAASERALDVWRWQSALPVSWRRIVSVKAGVVTALVLVTAGVLPYVGNLALTSDWIVNSVFRGAWPVWVGLLFAALGFYGGSLARDDYQGLLFSALPAVAIACGMLLADPKHMVFPAYLGYGLNFWKEWAVVGMLITLTTIVAVLAARVLKRHDQWTARKVAKHTVALLGITLVFTLYHVNVERNLITRDKPIGQKEAWAWNWSWPASNIQPAMYLGGTAEIENEQVSLSTEPGASIIPGVLIGEVHRGSSLYRQQHAFVIKGGRLREFPSSLGGIVTAVSKDGDWIETVERNERKTLSGPLG